MFHQQDYAIRFLTGLNDYFSVVRSQILFMDPLPNLNRIFSMVIQHERQGNISVVNEDSNALINATDGRRFVQGKGKGYAQNTGGRYSNKICSYCGKSGHTVETCYKKHGYPPNFVKNSAANNMVTDSYDGKDDDSTVMKESKGNPPSFTQEQYEKLLSLIQGVGFNHNALFTTHQVGTSTQHDHKPVEDSKSGKCLASSCHVSHLSVSWIIDSGASDHICSSMQWFQHFSEIKPVSVKLPNGHISIAKFSGTTSFSPGFHLENVLYIVDFAFNLLSVSKLCSSLKCLTNFYDSKCVI